ncbi:Peptidyl-prolyl cis-trans isomerase cyp18 [Pseudidiomarina piscicola]|uniref:Peptidyl-prolyl cis-trans isomerase n=1 Tax=Pseudidiomarina piscicola TaxID=2614830 RepID=A0A6S6WT94_9GAMM|nr:peptidylprolyl isomerase [Pseudidiomarina piscicola]CAB0149656.1 Peptidyl-prolyl cis-trans isomerase cyp18 [Pseudidiomarina piscicola]VZT39105.1 Peptidyl-prolyl cis-trans isomerase cyp18 [Pseudomonas aeruginosa]
MKNFVTSLVLGLGLLISPAQSYAKEIQPDNPFPRVKFVTSHGDIIVELNRHRAPLTVANFLKYVDIGSYDNTIFHRIVPGFVVQGGGYDAELTAKTEGAAIANESGNGLKNKYGTIAMARQNDPHTAIRQFFFNVKDNPSLDPVDGWGYAVFGVIDSGYETLDKLAEVESLPYHAETGWRDFPAEPPVLISAEILPQQ